MISINNKLKAGGKLYLIESRTRWVYLLRPDTPGWKLKRTLRYSIVTLSKIREKPMIATIAQTVRMVGSILAKPCIRMLSLQCAKGFSLKPK